MATEGNNNYRRWLFLILAVYLLLTTISTIATPLYRGPDEPAHVIYVKQLAHFRFPILAHAGVNDVASMETHEAHQPPLYYMIAAGPFRIVEALTGSVDSAARATRVVSMLLGALWICAVARLAEVLFGKSRKTLYATAFAAFIPMSSYIAGVVNNDIMICLAFTWAMTIMVCAIRQGSLPHGNALLLGLISGLAILSKAQGLLLLPLILLLPFFMREKSKDTFSNVLRSSLAAIICAAAVSGWWFVRNYLMYGVLIPQSLYQPFTSMGPFLASIGASFKLVRAVTNLLFMYFWGPFWVVDRFARISMDLHFYIRVAYMAVVMTALAAGLSGIVIRVLNRKAEQGANDNRIYFLFALSGLLIYISVIYQTIFVDKGVLQQGRLFLPVAGALGIAMVQGFTTIVQKPKARTVIARAGIASLIVLSLLFSFAVYYNYKFIEVSLTFLGIC